MLNLYKHFFNENVFYVILLISVNFNREKK
jgi:hypothetical protein